MSWLAEKPDLVRAFRRGDRAALTAVYQHYVGAVLALIRLGFATKGPPPRQVPGVADPDQQRDLLQEVFARALSERGRMSYDGLRPYRPFLLTITKNLRIDQLRRGRREVLASELREDALDVDDVIAGDRELPPCDAAEDHDWQSRRRSTVRFVQTLDSESQQVVRLRFEEEKSQAEVASAMRITRRRVRTLETRIQQQLKRFLQREGLW